MIRKVRGGDGVWRDQAGPAPDWRPCPPGALRGMRAEARALTDAAIGARDPGLAARAVAVRAEVRVVEAVRGYTPPVLDPSGPLPYGPARGGLDHVAIPDVAYDPRAGRDQLVDRLVRKRRGPTALSALPARLRAVAEAYADLAAAVASPGCPNPDAARRGGISDGGATWRCAMAARLRAAHRAIGTGLVLVPRGPGAHRDRPRLSIGARAVVDMVCLRGCTLRGVLAAHGWSRFRLNEQRVSEALEAALTRMAEVP
jgi:hypothetical protein